MYICVKLSPENLNPDPFPPHLTNTYTCRVSNTPKVCGSYLLLFLIIQTL